MPEPASSAPSIRSVPTLIREEIAAAGGVIPFARFMEIALYAPEAGYYERSPRQVGRGGDFYTSVSVGPLLGELLAFQFARWLEDPALAASDAPLDLVESGAHDGRLAADVLATLETRHPSICSRIRLWLVDPSPSRREWQRETLRRFGSAVRWVADLEELNQRTGGVRGIVYSNELLDAFPVHRLAWNATARSWAELGVANAGDGFAWTPLPEDMTTTADADRARLNALPRELLGVLPDGFAVETCPAAVAWWRKASGVLRTGTLLTLDYGFPDVAALRPEFPAGTLRAYRRHQGVAEVLIDPGAQDITAHVDFEVIARAGEASGLHTIARTSQRRWLTGLFEQTLAPGSGFPGWDPQRIRQFQTLTHPEHLGRRFQVLIQGRGMDPQRCAGTA